MQIIQILWGHMNQLKEPSCYEFQRLICGLKSAPFKAQYISQRNAKENKKELPLQGRHQDLNQPLQDIAQNFNDYVIIMALTSLS